MEFLRPDTNHLDACLITWNHPDTRLKVTTYPMVHIGSESFDQRVAEDLRRCQFILHEGVSWRSKKRQRSRWDLLARNLELADQQAALKSPAASVRINLDMPHHEFRERFFRLPLRSIAWTMFLRYIAWLLTLPRPFRREYIRRILLRKRHETNDDTPLRQLIRGSQDRRIVENLRAFYREHGTRADQAYWGIVFGAGHMPAICAGLRSLGFRPGSRRWVEVGPTGERAAIRRSERPPARF